jgi:aspartate-semialdehyde dehydrogenase
MKIAIIGASGLVGNVMLKVLEESNIQVTDLLAVATPKSVGKKLIFNNKEISIISIENAIHLQPQIAIFTAGSAVSSEYAPRFASMGTTVIDNSSFWRMSNEVPLIVPEINAHILKKNHKIIANPNCSTIQMVLALAPLHIKYILKRIVVSTYQSVTGSGVKAVKQLFDEREGKQVEKIYPHTIDLNCIPHGGSFLSNGYTTEEQKLIDETRKILNSPEIMVSPTVVRIPVTGGHSESVNAEFENEFEISDIYNLLSSTPGITLLDEPLNNVYPMPLFAQGKNDVFVGRIRRDNSKINCLNMWIVSDNLRKGAATNAIQIAEFLINNHLLNE